MEQKMNKAWVVAGVLAVILAITLGMMLLGGHNKKHDINHVLKDGYADLAHIRAEVAIKCDGPDANKEDCDKALAELSAILEDFSRDIDVASTSPLQATSSAQ